MCKWSSGRAGTSRCNLMMVDAGEPLYLLCFEECMSKFLLNHRVNGLRVLLPTEFFQSRWGDRAKHYCYLDQKPACNTLVRNLTPGETNGYWML